ncbi:MAG TPA: ABC transporter ATP-binding protein [Anaerolinea thermolimosa]|uniref:ABC transporter ATP-binding protein n=1 Tax=Anaerolinea thermolimosa TaxID=229919 RepID=A0A3D1JK28_9CHLR|nr:ABC transporter ATP-binding protein [Anaerolinea thermolimosa]GAP07055.1 ABC-type multidrug transport system, ATPase and permease components [Anaerolinea thermolimosa]HCE18098.1 ABC transporter ATP-binding protein [Anaerolinea thermolimosa]
MPPDIFEEEEFETKFTGTTFRRILGLLRPHWKIVVAFLIMIAITAGMDSLFTFVTKHIIDDGIMAKNLPALYRLLAIYAGMTVMQSFWVFGFIYSVGVLGERVRYDLRQMMFNHLQELSLSYYSRTPVGWIMSRVTSDSDRVADLITWGLLDITWAATSVISSLIFMLFINWKLALIVLVMVPVLVVVAVEFRKRILKEFRNVRKINSKITGQFNENITGVRVVKALVREDENAREFGVLTGDMYKAAYRAAWLSALFLPTVQLIAAFAISAIAWYGGLQAQVGLLTIGGIQAFVSYVTFMMWPIQDMARIFAEMQHAIASAERIFSLVDAVPDVANREGAFDPGTIKGDIEFDHVTFYYEENVPVLTDFNLKVKRGETIALVGPTGGGKSTIVNLLCRFYEPKEGVIRIGGVDYTRYSLHAIQSRIGVVLQTPHLFSGTIRENLRYGRLDATDAEIEEAAKLAGAHDFIMRFDKGYDEPVGEGGNNLSVGQKQLISLTRAILAKPEIFIMDEATSSVDTLTEALIQRGMERLMRESTSFIIAHRLSTIKRADRILVIEGGKIEEMGTHTELLRKRGKYYALYTRQFRTQMEEAFDPFAEKAPAPAD